MEQRRLPAARRADQRDPYRRASIVNVASARRRHAPPAVHRTTRSTGPRARTRASSIDDPPVDQAHDPVGRLRHTIAVGHDARTAPPASARAPRSSRTTVSLSASTSPVGSSASSSARVVGEGHRQSRPSLPRRRTASPGRASRALRPTRHRRAGSRTDVSAGRPSATRVCAAPDVAVATLRCSRRLSDLQQDADPPRA